MKVWLVLIAIVSGFCWWLWGQKPVVTPLPSPAPVSTPAAGILGLTQNEAALVGFSTSAGDYRAGWEIIEAKEVRVGVNLDLAESSEELRVGHNCRVLTSAAFYDTKDKPMGLLMSQTATLSAWKENQLLNGVIGWDRNLGELSISKLPTDYDWAVQAGPILWNQAKPLTLVLANDQLARRVVAGVTESKQLVLMVITAKDSIFSGPYLKDLPVVLEVLQQKMGVNLISAINLDGGTASAFLSPTFKLKELKPIGSYVCVRVDGV